MLLFYWSLGWTVNRNWQNRWRLECFVLTLVQANFLLLRFFHPLFRCHGLRQRILGITPCLYETDTSSNWQTGYFSSEDSAPIVWLLRDPGLNPRCRWRYSPGTQWQRYQASLPESCWCNPRSLLGHWIIWMASPGTLNGHIWFEKPSSTHHFPWSSFGGRHWLNPTGWTSLLNLTGWVTLQSRVESINFWLSDSFEASIINTQAETAIWLFIKQYESTCGRLGRLNKTSFQIGLDISLQGFQFH